jgi:NAD(P)-dependent dehydrogenase (short-subunit alcohol dehydrogenase family)
VGSLRFDGKVAIVTGAGRNLGREYALLLASLGARVVVNDLGVAISDTDGSGIAPETNPADDVVAEIGDAGGEAVASYDTITTRAGGEAIVQTALDAFGGVDVVVNNAGQVRTAPFADFSDELTATVVDTQLHGTLNVSRAAWRLMARSGGGRIVNVSSGAAFGGVPGGSVYSMAKMGVVGLTRAMASEGRADGIVANVISPSAKTRLGTPFGPIPWSDELGEWLHPRLVAPLVGWLAHDACPLTGEWFTVGGGHIARVGITVTDGWLDRDATVDSVAAHLDDIMRSPARPLDDAGGALTRMMAGYPGPT